MKLDFVKKVNETFLKPKASHGSWTQDIAAAVMTAETLAVLRGRLGVGPLPPASLQGEPGTHFLSSTQSQALRIPE